MPTYTKRPTSDTFLDQSAPAANFNTAGLRTGLTGGNIRRAILHFDLSDFPAYDSVDTADVRVNCVGAGFLDIEAKMHRLTQPAWVESGASWNEYAAGLSWASPGGDFVAAPAATFFQPRSNGIVQTTDCAPLVLDALTLRGSQLHVLLRQFDELTSFGLYTYTDREFEDAFGGEHPKLTVGYTEPPVVSELAGPGVSIGSHRPPRGSHPARPHAPGGPARPARPLSVQSLKSVDRRP